MEVKTYDGGKLGTAQVDEAPFGDKVLFRTLKAAVVMHQANQRQGTVKTKTRGEVRGTNKKPWKSDRNRGTLPARTVVSAAPLGAFRKESRGPMAYAMGYFLSPLQGFSKRGRRGPHSSPAIC